MPTRRLRVAPVTPRPPASAAIVVLLLPAPYAWPGPTRLGLRCRKLPPRLSHRFYGLTSPHPSLQAGTHRRLLLWIQVKSAPALSRRPRGRDLTPSSLLLFSAAAPACFCSAPRTGVRTTPTGLASAASWPYATDQICGQLAAPPQQQSSFSPLQPLGQPPPPASCLRLEPAHPRATRWSSHWSPLSCYSELPHEHL